MDLIRHCGCNKNSEGSEQGAKYQDKMYGKGMRVFTPDKAGSACRCTVCGKKQ
jgi:hypothetical protein